MTTTDKSVEEIVEEVASVCDEVEFLHGVPVKLPSQTKALLRGKVREAIKAERQKREEVVEILAELIPQQQECASGCGCSHHESYHPGGSCVWQPKEYYHADELEMLFKALTQPNNPN